MADDLYDRDFYLWTQAQAEARRSHGASISIEREGATMSIDRLPVLAAVLAMLACPLAACHDNLAAATAADANTCYRLPAGSTAKKVALADNDDNLETCAMHLEGYRLVHGLPAASGLYEDHVVFASPQGITASTGAGNIRYSVYTRAQQADLDGKLRTLIGREKAGGATADPN